MSATEQLAMPKTSSRDRQRAALAAAMLGFAVVTLDAQIVNVALPSIHDDLGGGLSGLQWIVSGYTLMFSSLLLFGGTIADRFGSRRAYRNGMLLFVVASAACALAPSLQLLILARLLQGTGAALVTPTALSLIREAYDDVQARAKAIAYWGVGGSIAAAAGPILGGLLTQSYPRHRDAGAARHKAICASSKPPVRFGDARCGSDQPGRRALLRLRDVLGDPVGTDPGIRAFRRRAGRRG
jgi:MFS family permease